MVAIVCVKIWFVQLGEAGGGIASAGLLPPALVKCLWITSKSSCSIIHSHNDNHSHDHDRLIISQCCRIYSYWNSFRFDSSYTYVISCHCKWRWRCKHGRWRIYSSRPVRRSYWSHIHRHVSGHCWWSRRSWCRDILFCFRLQLPLNEGTV
ncbi:hypothetical protein HOLleu_10508 [Holothuria leucospilota]|uniref:Secreted protein n=1 Tax=Holothuria leucospilota TaxID=206669 RepID=A0A9Q1CD95_HOLLE|nr:hypothetical protein HOLleu_10508 [Holothuria leucospilota]